MISDEEPVRVHGEQPQRDTERSQGMSEVTNEEDEERLGRTPRGISTQMATGGKKRASCYCCASQNMGTAATAVCC